MLFDHTLDHTLTYQPVLPSFLCPQVPVTNLLNVHVLDKNARPDSIESNIISLTTPTSSL